MSDTTNSLINTITVGTTIKGDIQANGDFRMDGTLEGNITLTGKLVLGEQGRIIGNVVCQNANVMGVIDGNLSVKEFLTLYASSRVKGDIVANKLAIEPGAYFTGSCHMLDELTD
ncbi:MAG: polymer-forming cytoskeletal protein [Bacteroidales bacterium]|nr:polymer-forming cytoskeletal protein [Bacteroidales bacterium]MBR3412089.1 polymer-forming cytoskeletal protein [Bacteroidales bacterium]